MTRNIIFGAILTALTAAAAVCAQTASPTASPSTNTTTRTELPFTSGEPKLNAPLETILSEAAGQVENYRETFRNLLADERKTFEKFDKNGAVKDKTVVESTLLVYQSPRNEKLSSELRNVTSVNGKLIPDSRQRSERFLAELQKAATPQKELEKLQKESARYDKTLEIFGLTVWEAVPLSENFRPYFDFQLAGTENLNGSEVYVVGYRQTRKSPYISLNEEVSGTGEPTLAFRLDVPGALKKSDALLRGKLWIDAKTFQVWREQRELVVQSEQTSPLVLLETIFEYQPSGYGILVPKQISFVSNAIKKNDNQYAAVRDVRVNFDYSKFRKTESDVKIIDDEP